jgi:chorismate mutase
MSVMQDEQLATIRQKIDQIDAELLALIKDRMALSAEVSRAKGSDEAIFRPGREAEMFARLAEQKGTLPFEFVGGLWRVIISASIALQKPDFSVVSTQSCFADALGLAAGQFIVHPPQQDASALLSCVLAGTADIALVSSDELVQIAPDIIATKKAQIIASISSNSLDLGAISSFVIACTPTDNTAHDIVVLQDKQTGKILFKPAQTYQSELSEQAESWHYLGRYARI